MRYNNFRLTVCGVLLVMAACAPQPATKPLPTMQPLTSTVAPLADTLPPSTATSIPPTSLIPTTISPELISEIDAMLGNLAKQNLFSGSVLIGRQGTVLLSQGYGLADREQEIPNTAQTRFRLASITKQFTAMAILILESQGKLSVQDPICKYFNDCPTAWEAIRIEHLLTHTSGIPDFRLLPEYRSIRATPLPQEQTIALIKGLPLEFQPGEKWSYGDSGYFLLGYIIEQASGQSYEDFLQQSIFDPLNLHDSGYDHNSNGLAVGYPDQYSSTPADYIDMSLVGAAGALYSTVEDLYRWEQALSTEQLVPHAYLDEMFAPHVIISPPIVEGNAFGYGWLIGTEHGRPILQHPGNIEGFATIVTRYPNEQIVIIVLSNQQNKAVRGVHNMISGKIFGDK